MITLGQRTKLPVEYVYFSVAKAVLFIFVLSLVFSMANPFLNVFSGFLAIIGIPWAIVIYIRYQNTAFVLAEKSITVFSGLITKKAKLIPFDKVQNIEAESGMLSRYFKLEKLSIWTSSFSQLATSKHGTMADQFLLLKSEDTEFLKDLILKEK